MLIELPVCLTPAVQPRCAEHGTAPRRLQLPQQDLMDRYIRGEDVSESTVTLAWLNTVQAGTSWTTRAN